MHYVHAYNGILYVLSKEGNRQLILSCHCPLNYPQSFYVYLVSFISSGKPPALIKSLAQARLQDGYLLKDIDLRYVYITRCPIFLHSYLFSKCYTYTEALRLPKADSKIFTVQSGTNAKHSKTSASSFDTFLNFSSNIMLQLPYFPT